MLVDSLMLGSEYLSEDLKNDFKIFIDARVTYLDC